MFIINNLHLTQRNLDNASEFIKKAANNEGNIIVLPEMFCCPYDNKKFGAYAEEVADSGIVDKISSLAKENNVYIVAGSIPEFCDNNLYNTSIVFNRGGKIIGKHRKIHLFDIDVEGKIKFTESDVLSSGDNITIFETEYCKIGLLICYDIRFPEVSRIMALKGAKLILVPAAFNMVTGPAHWDILIKARALDNQVYMGVCSQARNLSSSYIAYGHSMIVNPWGSVLKDAVMKKI